MFPYPKELRTRVVAAVDQGEHTIVEIARIFGVGTTFVKKMLRLNRKGQDLEPRHGGGAKPSLKEAERALIRAEVAKRPDVTLEELKELMTRKRQVSVSVSTISRVLQQLDLPRKKRV